MRALVTNLKDIAAVLATAEPKLKAEVYGELGISVTYDHARCLIRPSHGRKLRGPGLVSEGGLTQTPTGGWHRGHAPNRL